MSSLGSNDLVIMALASDRFMEKIKGGVLREGPSTYLRKYYTKLSGLTKG